MSVETTQHEDALPQILGEFSPVNVWQGHMNRVFYGLRGHLLRDYYQTFAAADFRLAYALAADYVERVRARDQRSEHSQDRPILDGPLIIHEWGCGNGNLAACFLDHVKALDREHTMYPRIQYVLIDSMDPVLNGAKANVDLAQHGERITFTKANVEDLSTFKDGTVDRIICNELWSELPTKLMLRKANDLMEEHLRPNLKESRLRDFPDWTRFIQAFDQADCDTLKEFPNFLEDIVWEREYHKVEGKEVPFRRVVTEFLKEIDEEILVPVNVGASLTIREAKRLLAPQGIGFSSFDAGTMDRMVLNDAEKPCYGMHGGQFNFMVNFALLENITKHVGGKQTAIEPQKEFVGRALDTNVISLMDLLASHPKPPQGEQWEMDHFILKTMAVINESFESPYERPIRFPLGPEMPADKRADLEDLVRSMKRKGIPDTIAYMTEEEVMSVMTGLETLGYDREGVRAALRVPAQSVDYYHFFFTPNEK